MNYDKHFEIKSFIIFDPTLSHSDEEEHKKILYYHPKSIDFEQRMKTIGLCEAMSNFATEFTDLPCQFIHTTKTRIIMHTLENKMMIIMTVNIPKKSANSDEYLEEQVQNSICSVILQHCRQMFFLFVGPPSYIIEKDGIIILTEKLQRFFDRYIGQGMLDGYQITDGLPGVQMLPIDKDTYMESEIVIKRLEAAYTDIIGSMLLFNNNVVYYTIDKDDLGILYRHLTTNLLAKHNLSESLDFSFRAYNMGKYIKWNDDDSENFCSSASKIVFLKTSQYLFQSSQKPKEALLHAYKALQATVVFFIDKEKLPTNSYLDSIDKFLGESLTKFASSLANKSGKFFSDTPYKYMYWNPKSLSIKCTLFPTRQCKSEFPPSIPSDAMQLMSDIKQEFDRYEKIHGKSIKEMAVKLHSDSWVIAVQNNNSQLYVAINKRNFSLVDVSKEMQHLCNRDFPNIFKLEID